MRLDEMLDRCIGLERRSAALYRRFAAASRSEPELCALWTTLAREEEEHTRALVDAAIPSRALPAFHTRLDGWADALAEVEARLAAAEALPASTRPEQQLSAALDLELSEIEALRHAALGARGVAPGVDVAHAARLADAAGAHPDDARLRLQAAILRARARLADHAQR